MRRRDGVGKRRSKQISIPRLRPSGVGKGGVMVVPGSVVLEKREESDPWMCLDQEM